jgi:hypothetical protein
VKGAASKWKSWLGLSAVAITLVASGIAALSPSPARKITALGGLELTGLDGKGNAAIYPAHFRFQNREHKFLRVSPTDATWHFTMLTNDSSGVFRLAFQAEPFEFRSPDDGDYYEFWMRDARLVNCDWKVHVTRRFSIHLPSVLHFITRSISTPADVWESDVMRPSLSNWKWEPTVQRADHFHFPDRPTPTNEQPAFLTNGSLFGEPELHYVR